MDSIRPQASHRVSDLKPMSLAATAVAPKPPNRAVGWKPASRISAAPVAMPTLAMTS